MDVHAQESLNGTRMSWNIWPSTRLEAAKMVVPLGCLYTPLKAVDGLSLVEYEPVVCRSRDCGAVLNPYCFVDFHSKTWGCPFCLQRNAFPRHYAEHITEANLPAELHQACTTMEYVIPQSVCQPPVFLIVLDVTLVEEELEQVKDSVQQCLAVMPQDALVGFVTFGALVYVHELRQSALPKAYAFRAGKEAGAEQVAARLGLQRSGGAAPEAAARFLAPVAECEFALSSLLDDLSRDAWPQGAGKRPLRCTGAALSVALGLAETVCAQGSVRVTLLVGGPCNSGPGMVVGEDLSETIRSHVDLQKDTPSARHTKGALTFYGSLASRAVEAGFAVDIFASSLDQVGLHEMRVLPDRTGGCLVMSDSFSLHVFKDSFRRMFDHDESGFLSMGFNAKIEVLTSREVKCSGAVGGLASLGKRGRSVSEAEVGQGGTCQWVAGAMDKNTTVSFFFDVAGVGGKGQDASAGRSKQLFLQFQTCYQHPSGRKRLRVTTVSHRMAEASDSGMADIAAGFDQEAAAVLMARYAVFKCESEEDSDVTRWVDRMLIRLCSRFADYRRGEPASFHLSPEFAMYPQFMYHLRRGSLLNTFNASPDETAYYRTHICRESTANSLVTIQPALLSYSFDEGPGQPVLLDACSLRPNAILLLDTFFQVVIWRGETIQAWFDAGYHESEEHANFKALLQAPAEDAKQVLCGRFPAPRFVQTSKNGSQERWLTSRVNPSTAEAPASHGAFGQAADRPVVLTDDVPLKTFMEALVKMAVQP